MSKISTPFALVFAAALAAGGIAHAQTKPAETTNVPQRAGEASTMTGGAPNVKTENLATTPRPMGTVNTAKPAETTNVPQRAGEASTMTGGQPNAKTSNTVTTDKKTSQSMGNKSGAAMHSGSHTTSGKAAAAETSNTPQRPGEASTMTGGAPNAKTTN